MIVHPRLGHEREATITVEPDKTMMVYLEAGESIDVEEGVVTLLITTTSSSRYSFKNIRKIRVAE